MGSSVTVQFAAERKHLADIRDFVQRQAEKAGMPVKDIEDLVQAVDEAATNIIVHGYQEAPGKIEIETEPQGDRFLVALRDRAPIFDPREHPEPDITLPLEERPLGGLGIHMIRRCVDAFYHQELEGGGNELVLVKKYKPEK